MRTAKFLEISMNSRMQLQGDHSYFDVCDAREATTYGWAKHMHVCGH